MKRLRCPHCGELTDPLIPIRGDYQCWDCKGWFRVSKRKDEHDCPEFRDNDK